MNSCKRRKFWEEKQKTPLSESEKEHLCNDGWV